MGWTLSCMTLNSSHNTHNSSCSCWKSSTYDNGIFKGIHYWKNPHSSFGQHWKSLVLISLIQNPHACSQATETVGILKPKAIVNISTHSVWHLQQEATNISTIMLKAQSHKRQECLQLYIVVTNKHIDIKGTITLKAQSQIVSKTILTVHQQFFFLPKCWRYSRLGDFRREQL